MTALLEVRHLVKRFKNILAVDDVSFAIAEGICFGLLGPNGAGKTTTIEMIEDIIAPDDGDILYRGRRRKSGFSEKIGIQFQHTSLLAFITVRETLQTFQRLYNNPADLDWLVDLCQLEELLPRYTDRISGGQRQRVLIALALINNPDLVFLDEPSIGLDPQARRNMWDIVRQIKREGKTIILTTHYMEEAEYLCDEIAIIDQGRIIAQGTPPDLVHEHFQGATIVLPRHAEERLPADLAAEWHETAKGLEIHTDDINACLKHLVDRGVDLADVVVRSPNLEDVFLKLTGRKLRE